MTQEEKETLITHWMDLVCAVFVAENRLANEWLPKLKSTQNAPQHKKEQLADDYVRAIATEIVEKGVKE